MKKSIFICLVLVFVFLGCTQNNHVLLKSNIDDNERFGTSWGIP